MLDIDALKAAIPEIAIRLAKRMVDEALTDELGLSLEELMPTVAAVYKFKDDDRQIKVSLSLEWTTDD